MECLNKDAKKTKEQILYIVGRDNQITTSAKSLDITHEYYGFSADLIQTTSATRTKYASNIIARKLDRTEQSSAIICSYLYILLHYVVGKQQGRRKLFITGQAKLNPEDYSIKCIGSQ